LDYRIRNLLLVLIVVSLFASLFFGAKRLVVEERNKNVEFAMDWNDVVVLSEMNGIRAKALLKELKKVGVRSIALPEDTLDTAERRGDLSWVRGSDALSIFRITAKAAKPFRSLLTREQLNTSRYFIRFATVDLYTKIKDELTLQLGRNQVREKDGYILEVEDDEWDLVFLGIGMPQSVYSMLKGEGFKVIPRLKNNFRINSKNLARKINLQRITYDDDVIIFDEDEVLGYPYSLGTLASELSSREIRFGYIEFSEQLGDRTLSRLMRKNVIRIHSIPADEMEIMTEKAALARWMRAVRERSVRLLYIHPFFRTFPGKSLVETNLTYITRIADNLRGARFNLGSARPLEELGVPFVGIMFIFLGITAGLLFLSNSYVKLPDWAIFLSIILTVAGVFLFGLVGKALLLRKLGAFLSAATFPALGIIGPFTLMKNDGFPESITRRMAAFLAAIGIAVCGALIIVGLLSDTLFMVGAEKFAGVKLALIIPVLLVAVYFLKEESFEASSKKVLGLLSTPLSIGHIVLLGLIGAFGFLFVLRSGNFGIGVPGFERYARDALEGALMIRPRTKEFLIGYPALFLTTWYYNRIPKDWIWLPLSIATVALISLVNTFCHIHSPLFVSAIRSINGVILGAFIGAVAIVIIDLAVKFVSKYKQ
jgi:hypothetical protein